MAVINDLVQTQVPGVELDPDWWAFSDEDIAVHVQEEIMVIRWEGENGMFIDSLHPDTRMGVASGIWPWSLGEEILHVVTGKEVEQCEPMETFIVPVTITYRYWKQNEPPWPIGMGADNQFHFHLGDGYYQSVMIEKR